jgi:soluble lytic murein transglycosylase-like protein
MTPYRDLIVATAAGHGLDPNLVEAIVIAESSGCTDAFRYEPGFYRRYLESNPKYADQNPRRVSSSYGLMQVMFSTAQQYGFSEVPEALFVPETGLQYGCLHLKRLMAWAKGDTRKAAAAYNGGQGAWRGADPQAYAKKVLKLLETVELVHPTGRATNGLRAD